MTMIKKIDKFLNSQKMAQVIAKELVDVFITYANKENVEYDFELAKGTGRLKNDSPNTIFSYDPSKRSNMYKFKTALFNKDLEDIKEGSEEEQQLIKDVHAFLDKVKEIINTNNVPEIRGKIRKVVLPASQSEDIPMNDVRLMTIEAIDYSSIPESSKYLMRIGKAPDSQVDTEAIIQYINACQEKSSQSVEEIFEEEKTANNPLFNNVTSVELGKKYIFEVTMVFYVDYSLSQMPPKPPEIAPSENN